jgi:RNA polymerase sigma-70 factor (ECF subfamily)
MGNRRPDVGARPCSHETVVSVGKRFSSVLRRTGVSSERVRLASTFSDASEPLADRVVSDVDAQHGQDLLGFARRSGLDDTTAEEAVQDALVRLWLEIRSGATILEPRAWTFRTLYRIAMDHHRFVRRARELAERFRGVMGTTTDVDHDRRLSIWSLVDQLPTRQRQVVYLRYRADFAYEEIGLVMGITASAARAHATKAGVALRRAIGTDWND